VKLHISTLLALKLAGFALAFVGAACLFHVAVFGDTLLQRCDRGRGLTVSPTLAVPVTVGRCDHVSQRLLNGGPGHPLGTVGDLGGGALTLCVRRQRGGAPDPVDDQLSHLCPARLPGGSQPLGGGTLGAALLQRTCLLKVSTQHIELLAAFGELAPQCVGLL